jgi:hypothetical protein
LQVVQVQRLIAEGWGGMVGGASHLAIRRAQRTDRAKADLLTSRGLPCRDDELIAGTFDNLDQLVDGRGPIIIRALSQVRVESLHCLGPAGFQSVQLALGFGVHHCPILRSAELTTPSSLAMDAGQVALLAAAIAAAVSLVVAGITSGVALLTSWRQRKHERGLARIEREYQRRADAYLEALTLVNHGMDWVNRTLPVISPGPEPPASVPDDSLRRANALAALFGSPRTLALMQQLAQAQREFALHVEAHESAKAANRQFADPGEWGSWRKLQETRGECRRLLTEIEQAMRDDLERE